MILKVSNNKIPQGWVECQLGEVFETSSGGTPKRGNPEYYQNGTIPWIKSGELNNSIIYSAEEFITEEGLNNSSAKIFPKGSLLIALYGATVGKLGILDFDSATNQAVCCIYQNTYYDRNFLFYYLLLKKEYLVNQGKGGAQPNISQEIVKSLFIPFPPFNEQRRIVEKIESEFAKIDDGLEHLENAKEQIKQYRQSVLKSAFEGKLTQQNPDNESAEILLQKINPKANFKHNDKLPQGWIECQMEDILSNEKYSIKRGPFGSSLKKTFFVPAGIRVFEQYNPINNDPYWSRYYITESKYKELEAFTAKAGDFLISCSGTLGKILQLPVDVELGIINQALLKITVNNDLIDSKFFINLFQSPKFQKNILDNTIGTAIQNIASVKELKKIKILLPPLNEQKRIVEEIEKKFAVADEVEKVVDDNIEKAKQLKQSILKKAFEGRLVPQDPTDEPASTLLEKIKQERSKK